MFGYLERWGFKVKGLEMGLYKLFFLLKFFMLFTHINHINVNNLTHKASKKTA